MSQQDLIASYREKILHTMQDAGARTPESGPPVPAAALGEQMLDEAIALPESTRNALMHGLTPEDSTLLLGMASGKAVCAVRDGAPEELRYGLIALVLEDRRQDWRETLRMLCLLNHSAGKLGVNLEAIYQSLKPLASTETARLMSGYFEGGERDIRAMGYKEDTSPDGFIYTRTG